MSAALFNRLRPRAGRTAGLAFGAALVVACAVIFFALNAVYGFLGSSTASSGAQRTATVSVGTVQSSVSASGNVSAANTASVDFGTSGTVTAVNVAVGDHVTAGQVLGTIDPTTAQTTLEAAQANLAQAENALATAQNGPTAAQQASNASTLLQAQSSLTAAQQQLTVDQAAVTTAKTQLTKDQALVCPPTGTTSSSSSTASSSQGVTNVSPASTTGTTAAQTGAQAPSSGGAATQTRSNTVNQAWRRHRRPTHNNDDRDCDTDDRAFEHDDGRDPPAPAASAGQASNIGSATATLSGTVDPSGTDTTYHFEYGTSSSSLGSKTAAIDAGSGSVTVSVTADVAGLKTGATYYFRVVATSAAGTTNSAVVSFATLAAAKPVVTTSSATNLLTTTATLNGSVDPNGSDTTYRFEYGTTAAYGSQTAVVKLAAGTTATNVSAALTGLKPNTAYLFRLVATNSSGTSVGIGQIAKTAQSSCVSDTAAITSAEQTLAQQQTAVKTAEDNLAQTKATIAETTTPSSATIAQDEAAVKQDQATVAADLQALQQTTLKAPIAGTVTAVNGSVGSTVTGTGSSVSHGAASSSSSSSAGGAGGRLGDVRLERLVELVVLRDARLPRQARDRLRLRRGRRDQDRRRPAGDDHLPGAPQHRRRGQGDLGLEHVHGRQQRRHLRRHDRPGQPAVGGQAGHDRQRQRRRPDAGERPRASELGDHDARGELHGPAAPERQADRHARHDGSRRQLVRPRS